MYTKRYGIIKYENLLYKHHRLGFLITEDTTNLISTKHNFLRYEEQKVLYSNPFTQSQ